VTFITEVWESITRGFG